MVRKEHSQAENSQNLYKRTGRERRVIEITHIPSWKEQGQGMNITPENNAPIKNEPTKPELSQNTHEAKAAQRKPAKHQPGR